MSEVSFTPGQIYRRRELHDKYGGQRQGGISTPKDHPFVLLITGDSGKQYGYEDRWTGDGIFLYTGEGQRGDMRFVSGNRAIRDHLAEGKALCLFEQMKKDERDLRYVGEMQYIGHELRPAPDVDGTTRQAIVFRLRPAGVLKVDNAALSAILEPEARANRKLSGGGFGSDPETNRKVEKAAIEFVRKWYEHHDWTVESVEADKCGYDLNCTRAGREAHVEVKGVQGKEVGFIITAGEVRNALLDRSHVTAVVTGALSADPQLHSFTREEFFTRFELNPVAYRARLNG